MKSNIMKETNRLGVIAVVVAAAAMITISPMMFATAEAELRGQSIKQFDDNRKSNQLVTATFSGAVDSADNTNVDPEETIVISGDHCGSHDESTGTSYPIDCETGEPS
jgi:hypothetical protein